MFLFHVGLLLWTSAVDLCLDCCDFVEHVMFVLALSSVASRDHRAHFHQLFESFFPSALVDEHHEQKIPQMWASEQSPTLTLTLVHSQEVKAVVLRRVSIVILLLTLSSSALWSTASLASLTSAHSVFRVCLSSDKKEEFGMINHDNPQIILTILKNPLRPVNAFSFVSLRCDLE